MTMPDFQTHCACRCLDARDCFLARHPECRRIDDNPCDYGDNFYNAAMDERCECTCHHEIRQWERDEEEYEDQIQGR